MWLRAIKGRSEFGQRALGNRSILANPKADGVLQKINTQIKNLGLLDAIRTIGLGGARQRLPC